MADERVDTRIGARLRAVVPDLDGAVAATGDEAAAGGGCSTIRGAGDRGRRRRRRPRHGIGAQRVRRHLRRPPLVVAQLQHRHAPVGRRAGQHAAGLGRGPRDDVDGGGVGGVVVGLRPAGTSTYRAASDAARALAPHDDAAVEAAARQQRAELRVRPAHAPHRAAVALQRVRQPMRRPVRWALQCVDLHCLV